MNSFYRNNIMFLKGGTFYVWRSVLQSYTWNCSPDMSIPFLFNTLHVSLEALF